MTFEMVSKLIPADENIQVIVQLNDLKLEAWGDTKAEREDMVLELGHLPVAEISTNADIGCMRVVLAAGDIMSAGVGNLGKEELG